MTECIPASFAFQPLGYRDVRAGFDGGRITSDAGALLLREVDTKFGFLDSFAACFTDDRAAEFIEHPLVDLLKQRVFGICLGYEGLNDRDQLRLYVSTAVPARRGGDAGVAGIGLEGYADGEGPVRHDSREAAEDWRVRVSVRCVLVSLSESYPFQEWFAHVWANLRALVVPHPADSRASVGKSGRTKIRPVGGLKNTPAPPVCDPIERFSPLPTPKIEGADQSELRTRLRRWFRATTGSDRSIADRPR